MRWLELLPTQSMLRDLVELPVPVHGDIVVRCLGEIQLCVFVPPAVLATGRPRGHLDKRFLGNPLARLDDIELDSRSADADGGGLSGSTNAHTRERLR